MRTSSEVKGQNAEGRSAGASGHLEFYYSPLPPADGQIVVTGPEARHVARVMRHGVGDRIRVTDGAGTEHEVELTEVKADKVTGRVLISRQNAREPKHRVAIAQAVLKGDKLAQVCQQATELGVAEIIPIQTARTVGRLSPAKLERLKGVSLAALKSSTRTALPRTGEVVGLRELVATTGRFGQTLVAYEEERGPGLPGVLDRNADSVLLAVGPEGGFEPSEIDALRAAGAKVFSLGPRRLRAETAAVAAAAMALGLLGDLG